MAELAWSEYQAGVSTMGQYCIKYAPSHLAACLREKELQQLLLGPDWIQAKLQATGVVQLLADYDLALGLQSVGGLQKPRSTVLGDSDREAVDLVHDAIRLSSHVIAKDPDQFASQMVGRLMSYEDMPVIADFTERVVESA